jgi:hypothetical protein
LFLGHDPREGDVERAFQDLAHTLGGDHEAVGHGGVALGVAWRFHLGFLKEVVGLEGRAFIHFGGLWSLLRLWALLSWGSLGWWGLSRWGLGWWSLSLNWLFFRWLFNLFFLTWRLQ